MQLFIVIRPNDLVVRLPSDDPEVATYSVDVLEAGQDYAGLSYDYLRSLGSGGWEIPDDPAERLTSGAKRLPYGVLDSSREEQEAEQAARQRVKART